MGAKTEGHLDVDLGNPGLGWQTMIGKTSGETHCISLYFMRKQHIKNPMDSIGMEAEDKAEPYQTLCKKVRTFCYLLPKYHHEISLRILITFSL